MPPPIVPSAPGATSSATSPIHPNAASEPPRTATAWSNESNAAFASGSARNFARIAVSAWPTSWTSA